LSEIRNPIIVVGAGRTGSTIFHSMLSRHPGLAWLPGGICNKFPDYAALSRLSLRLIDYPLVGELAKRKIKPAECYPFWEHHCRGFSAPYRDLVASDVTEIAKTRVRETMSKIRTETRDRLLIKITGWPRIGFLSEIFEDAKFVHVMRDGRAVVNSMMNVHFWRGWGGPQGWGWGELSPAQEEEWNRYDQSFVVLAAIQWKILMDAMENAKAFVESSDLIEIKYEELSSDPTNTLMKVATFCDLEWPPRFERDLQKFRVKNTNNKFKNDLTSKQQKDLEEVLGAYLVRYGYL
jgi:omega-hydroxy-beta-dihydromenaquinone-9 sulfotransferase